MQFFQLARICPHIFHMYLLLLSSHILRRFLHDRHPMDTGLCRFQVSHCIRIRGAGIRERASRGHQGKNLYDRDRHEIRLKLT